VVNILVKSQAFESGMRPGDLITGLGHEPVLSAQDLVSRVAALSPGATVQLEGRHGRQPYKVDLKVLERPTVRAQTQAQAQAQAQARAQPQQP
jgi:S1-C subfamily serine protease